MKTSSLLKKLVGCAACLGGLRYFIRKQTAIFTFHRVVTQHCYNTTHFQKSLLVTEKGFSRFLGWLQTNFTVIALADLARCEKDKSKKPYGIITFDDGWQDNYQHAFPALVREKLPATIFLSTHCLEGSSGFWWQDLGELLTDTSLSADLRQQIHSCMREHITFLPVGFDAFHEIDALIAHIKSHCAGQADGMCSALYTMADRSRKNRCLSWDQCREMSTHAITFGSHTLTHARLSTLTDSHLQQELSASKKEMLRQNIAAIDAICYPYGDYDRRVLEVANQLYHLGLTTNSGLVTSFTKQRLTLPRINITDPIISSRYLLQYRLLKAALNSIKNPLSSQQ